MLKVCLSKLEYASQLTSYTSIFFVVLVIKRDSQLKNNAQLYCYSVQNVENNMLQIFWKPELSIVHDFKIHREHRLFKFFKAKCISNPEKEGIKSYNLKLPATLEQFLQSFRLIPKFKWTASLASKLNHYCSNWRKRLIMTKLSTTMGSIEYFSHGRRKSWTKYIRVYSHRHFRELKKFET